MAKNIQKCDDTIAKLQAQLKKAKAEKRKLEREEQRAKEQEEYNARVALALGLVKYMKCRVYNDNKSGVRECVFDMQKRLFLDYLEKNYSGDLDRFLSDDTVVYHNSKSDVFMSADEAGSAEGCNPSATAGLFTNPAVNSTEFVNKNDRVVRKALQHNGE